MNDTLPFLLARTILWKCVEIEIENKTRCCTLLLLDVRLFSHTKLLILPTFIFYILFYKKNKVILNKNKFFSSMIIQLISSILSMILIYYTARFGFNIESLWFDIFLFFLSIVIGLTLSIHYYKYSKKSINYKIWSFIIIGLMIIFTINPLNFPFFIFKKS